MKSKACPAVPFFIGCAFATSLLCSAAAVAAVPSGATASPTTLRQAYLDAVKTSNVAALEALFDTTMDPPGAIAGFRRHLAREVTQKISAVLLIDPETTLKADYSRYHAHFPEPVVNALKITFVSPLGESEGTEYYIGSSAGRYYFVSAVQDGR